MPAKTKPKPNPIVDGLKTFERTLDKALDVAVKNPDALPGAHETEGNPITLSPRVPTAENMVEKLIANAQNAAERWLANVQRPKKAPLEAAKKAAGKYKQKMTQSLTDDLWLKGINAVDEDAMYETIRNLGSGVYTSGVGARKAKALSKFSKLQPLILALTNTLDAMPVDTEQQREAKMLAAKRGMQAIGKKLKGLS